MHIRIAPNKLGTSGNCRKDTRYQLIQIYKCVFDTLLTYIKNHNLKLDLVKSTHWFQRKVDLKIFCQIGRTRCQTLYVSLNIKIFPVKTSRQIMIGKYSCPFQMDNQQIHVPTDPIFLLIFVPFFIDNLRTVTIIFPYVID